MKCFLVLCCFSLSSCAFFSSDLNKIKNDHKVELLRHQEKDLHPFAIIQGLTTESSTEIKVIAKTVKEISFKLFYNEKEIKTIKVVDTEAGKTGYTIYNLIISSLKIDTNYTLQVIEKNMIADQRNFQTVNLEMVHPNIGVVSCMHDKYKTTQFKMWNDYLKQNPTYTFMIGDNVYADTLIRSGQKKFIFKYATEANLWKRYIQTFKTLSYYRASRLVPTLGIWDDHDYGYNNGDESYPYKAESLKVFQAFYGFSSEALKSKKPVVSPLEGAGYVFKAFGQNFVFIDNRTFRSKSLKTEKKNETHLGPKQTAEIINILKSKIPTWLIKGDQFFGAYHRFESFEGDHPNDFSNFLSAIKKSSSRVLFVSGDRHLNELMKIEEELLGYETFELTSSAIHAAIFPNAWKKNPNSRQVQGFSGIHNYSVVKIQSVSPWALTVTSYGPDLKVLFQENLEIGQKK